MADRLFIDQDCGMSLGRPERVQDGHVSTFHAGTCDICGNECAVTEPRDYGHLRPGWEAYVKEMGE